MTRFNFFCFVLFLNKKALSRGYSDIIWYPFFWFIFEKVAHKIWSPLLRKNRQGSQFIDPICFPWEQSLYDCVKGSEALWGVYKILYTKYENSREKEFYNISKNAIKLLNLKCQHLRKSRFDLMWVKFWREIWGNSESDYYVLGFWQI